jgi:hypothetical protein
MTKKLQCSKCKKIKPVSDFHRQTKRKRGYAYDCKECCSKYRREYHLKNKDYVNEVNKKYYQLHKEKIAKHYVGNGKYTQKHRARQATNSAVRDGKLPNVSTLKCVDCGNDAQQYHHHKGYAKKQYLEVIPLCVYCHIDRDR